MGALVLIQKNIPQNIKSAKATYYLVLFKKIFPKNEILHKNNRQNKKFVILCFLFCWCWKNGIILFYFNFLLDGQWTA